MLLFHPTWDVRSFFLASIQASEAHTWKRMWCRRYVCDHSVFLPLLPIYIATRLWFSPQNNIFFSYGSSESKLMKLAILISSIYTNINQAGRSINYLQDENGSNLYLELSLKSWRQSPVKKVKSHRTIHFFPQLGKKITLNSWLVASSFTIRATHLLPVLQSNCRRVISSCRMVGILVVYEIDIYVPKFCLYERHILLLYED